MIVALLGAASCRAPEASKPKVPAGTIEGVVRLTGPALPTPTRIENTTDPDVCGRGQTLDDVVVAADDRGLRWVIVTLVDVPESSLPASTPGRVELDNSGCRFSPHAAVATLGSTIEAVNDDPILHTTHLYGPADMNISLPLQGTRATRELARPGLYIVKCDIHGWMQAFVQVDPHPFHSVTDAEGRFRIESVPAGHYRLSFWQERLGAREVGVQVEGGRTTSVDMNY
jgi:plastocyanin